MYPIIELLTIKDITRVFHVSQQTVYRWVALARKGKSKFPLPIGGRKQKLLWHRHIIEDYCQEESPLRFGQ
jgi:transposase